MDSAKNVRWIIPFKKFGMARVNCPGIMVRLNHRQDLTSRSVEIGLIKTLSMNLMNLKTCNNSNYICGGVYRQ